MSPILAFQSTTVVAFNSHCVTRQVSVARPWRSRLLSYDSLVTDVSGVSINPLNACARIVSRPTISLSMMMVFISLDLFSHMHISGK